MVTKGDGDSGNRVQGAEGNPDPQPPPQHTGEMGFLSMTQTQSLESLPPAKGMWGGGVCVCVYVCVSVCVFVSVLCASMCMSVCLICEMLFESLESPKGK